MFPLLRMLTFAVVCMWPTKGVFGQPPGERGQPGQAGQPGQPGPRGPGGKTPSLSPINRTVGHSNTLCINHQINETYTNQQAIMIICPFRKTTHQTTTLPPEHGLS